MVKYKFWGLPLAALFYHKSTGFIDFYKITLPLIRGGLKPTAFAKLTSKSQKRRVSTLRIWDEYFFKINKPCAFVMRRELEVSRYVSITLFKPL